MISVFEKKPCYPYCFTPKITPLSLMIFFFKTFIPILFLYFLWKGIESLLHVPAA